jgi:GAF domain-containing protein
LNTTMRVNHVGGTDQPVLLQLRETSDNEPWVVRPDWVKAQRIRSFGGQPLIFKEEVLGVLGVFSRTPINEQQFGWLRAFADHAAAAITNIRATEHIRVLNAQVTATAERNRTLLEINNAIITNLTQEALLQSIARALRRVISFDRSAITLYKPETGTFRFLAVEGHLLSDFFRTGLEVGHDATNVGWVFDHQQPLVRRDLDKEHAFANERRLSAEGIRSMCVAPLIFLGKSIGTLSIVSRLKDQYSEADAAFLQEVANQVALAVVNMKSYEEIAALNRTVARTANQLRTLLDINNAIITNLSEEALLRSFSEAVRRVVPFDRAALTLYLPACPGAREAGVCRPSLLSYPDLMLPWFVRWS